MSDRELAKKLIDKIPENRLPYVISYLQGAAVPDRDMSSGKNRNMSSGENPANAEKEEEGGTGGVFTHFLNAIKLNDESEDRFPGKYLEEDESEKG